MGKEFVDGWDMERTLGEGACGKVSLLVNRQTQEAVALKTIYLQNGNKELFDSTRKEVGIHRLLDHNNIIKFYGHRKDVDKHFIFLEYASCGELFDRIEPDYGMLEAQARNYFAQIISGVEYLHSIGIAHRDLKPENILLDDNGTIKISDFGLATVFRHNGKERHLNKRCGTLSYVSPEVFTRVYRAEPSDIWSCGIILVAMLAGELPWDQPTMDCSNFARWRKCDYSQSPWPKIENLSLGLLKKILEFNPDKRYTISEIKNHLWYRKKRPLKGVSKWSPESNMSYKRQCSEIINHLLCPKKDRDDFVPSCTQPEPMRRTDSDVVDISGCNLMNNICLSQPANLENMMVCSQMSGTQGDSSQAPVTNLLGKRMTRFCVKMGAQSAYEELKIILDKLGYTWKKFASGQIVINTVDQRKTNLVFKATLLERHDYVLFDFRLSRGDGLEFKRHFLAIKALMSHIIVKIPAVWSQNVNI